MSAHLTILQPTMKTRHIIAIGLLSATAIGILAIRINTNKRKTTESKADEITNIVITDNKIKQINYTDTKEFFVYNRPEKSNFTYTAILTEQNNITEERFTINVNQILNQTPTSINITDYSIDINKKLEEIQKIEISIANILTSPNQFIYTLYIDNKFTDNTNTLTQYQIIGNANFTQNIIAGYQTNIFTIDVKNNTTQIITQYTAGQTNGYQTGYTEGEDYGYATGYNDSDAFNHPIALQPLMLNILTMPFTFISQAFDVTLWPGTAYEFNFANFIKGMIAIATILFIIKIFTSGFAVIGNYTGKVQNHKLTKSQIEYNKAKADLTRRTDPNNKTRTSTSHNTNVNINKKG